MLTNLSQPFGEAKSAEELHAATVGDIHLGPLCCVQVSFNHHGVDAMASELGGKNKASWTSANYQHWRFVADDLDTLMLEMALCCLLVKTCCRAGHLVRYRVSLKFGGWESLVQSLDAEHGLSFAIINS